MPKAVGALKSISAKTVNIVAIAVDLHFG